MAPPTRLVLLGAGGHASDVLGVIEAINGLRTTFEVIGLLDDDSAADPLRFAERGVGILGPMAMLEALGAAWVAAVGYPGPRRRVVTAARATGLPPVTLVSPGADVGLRVHMGAGTVVMGAARLSPRACVGEHVLVSYLSAVGHDSVIGDGASVMPGAMVSGGVEVGAGAVIGTNAAVLEGIRIGDHAVVGAGAVVVEDVAPGVTVLGVPARPVDR